MKYFSTYKECKNANPSAKWFYHDSKGIGGQTRWFATKRILKKAKEKIAMLGYSPGALLKMKDNFVQM
jgi:hypothetical protein